MSVLPFRNATVNQTRAGVAGYTNRRVYLEWDRLDEHLTAQGGVVRLRLIDSARADWRQDDILTVVTLDRQTLPETVKYEVGQVIKHPAPLPTTEAELLGGVF